MWGLTAYNCIGRLVFSLQLFYTFDFESIIKAWDTCFSYEWKIEWEPFALEDSGNSRG